MSKGGRSLRFESPDAMPPGMRALYAEQQTRENQRLSRVVPVLKTPPAVGKTTTQSIELLKSMLENNAPVAVTGPNPKRAKYGAIPTYVDGIRFDSKREARYYEALKLRVAAREVRFFLRQVPFHLPGGTKLVVDFAIHEADGRVRFVDVKGRETPVFRLKKREVEHHYPVEIELA